MRLLSALDCCIVSETLTQPVTYVLAVDWADDEHYEFEHAEHKAILRRRRILLLRLHRQQGSTYIK